MNGGLRRGEGKGAAAPAWGVSAAAEAQDDAGEGTYATDRKRSEGGWTWWAAHYALLLGLHWAWLGHSIGSINLYALLIEIVAQYTISRLTLKAQMETDRIATRQPSLIALKGSFGSPTSLTRLAATAMVHRTRGVCESAGRHRINHHCKLPTVRVCCTYVFGSTKIAARVLGCRQSKFRVIDRSRVDFLRALFVNQPF